MAPPLLIQDLPMMAVREREHLARHSEPRGERQAAGSQHQENYLS